MPKQLPDHFLESDEFDFIAPEDEHHDLRKHIYLTTGTVFHVARQAPQWHHEGEAIRQTIAVEQKRSVVTKPQSVFRTAITSLFSAPHEEDRGQLHEAPRALPAPSRQPLLPAPQPLSHSPQIADRREVELPSADRVAAVFLRRS